MDRKGKNTIQSPRSDPKSKQENRPKTRTLKKQRETPPNRNPNPNCDGKAMTSPPTSPPSPTVDLYAQALKALSERCPFDTEEFSSRSPNLPYAVAARLSKHSDGRKKFKKPSSSSHGDQAPAAPDAAPAPARNSKQSSSWWEEMEAYFRMITEADIESLRPRVLVDSCFLIPVIEAPVKEAKNEAVVELVSEKESSLGEKENDLIFRRNEVGVSSDLSKEREEKGSTLPVSEVVVGEEEEGGDLGLNWVLGSKHRAILTTQRPTKKRKLLGSDAGLDQLLALPRCEEGSISCDVCCLGETQGKENRIVLCVSCGVLVHRKCYGLHGDVEEPWVCYRCKHLATSVKCCLLCPKEVGALKLVGGDCKNGDKKFAHLFCSIWTPEVYVEDTCAMEPVVNVEGVPEMRKKLVCNVCKVKHGVCVRCSFGTCRTSFHPICARDARYQMEIWGKFGRENVELRAFCSKHSTSQDVGSGQRSENLTRTIGDYISVVRPLPAAPLANKLPKLRLSCKIKEKNTTQAVVTSSVSNDVITNETTPGQNAWTPSPEGVEMQSLKNIDFGVSEGDTNLLDICNLIKLIRKLIGRGKLIVGDVASEMGISSDSLQTALMGEISSFTPELRLKMTKWFQESVYVPASMRNLKFRNGTAISSGSLAARVGCPNATDVTDLESLDLQGSTEIADADNLDACCVISLSSHGRIKNKAEILKEEKAVCSPREKIQQSNGELAEETDQILVVHTNATKEDAIGNDRSQCKDESVLEMTAEYTHPSPNSSPPTLPPRVEVISATLEKNELLDPQQHPEHIAENVLSKKLDIGEANLSSDDAIEKERSGGTCSSSYVHPYIQKRLMQIRKGMLFYQESKESNSNGHCEDRLLSSRTSGPCNHNSASSIFTNLEEMPDSRQLEQLTKAKETGILEFPPEDEIEGEMLYLQNRLLDNALEIKHNFEDLLGMVVKRLPHELCTLKKRQWDLVFVNQFLREVKEAKKRGRKERRHREAQVVLAAATTSSRLRKDGNHDTISLLPESPQKVNPLPGRAAGYSPLGPRLKETPTTSIARFSLDKNSCTYQLPEFSKEKSLSCDICRRSETLLNRIFVCSSCRVAVHLDCYRKLKDPIGPWKCELCEEMLQTTSPRNQMVEDREKPWLVTECALCGGGSGAFRKATNGQWVHAFCAEWLLESTFRRGQQNLVDGMDIISKEKDLLTCCICHQTFGVCLKCSYGHCQVAFHPYCARAAGFYMNAKTMGGRFQHRAYCEKHSVEQKQKADDQQHGTEELKSIKQIRFELEKVRILCERIVKREKIKRDLVLCSHDILASRKDYVAYSLRTRRPYVRPGVSSESATTSIDNKSYSEAIQRSEDITVDSTVSGKCSIRLSLDMDRKTDDSSTSQPSFKRKIADRTSCSGKQLPHRTQSFSFQKLANDGDKRFKARKPTENFHKEVVMTSYQASVQNRKLPKGFVYVPIDSLSNEKPVIHDSNSHEPEEPGG